MTVDRLGRWRLPAMGLAALLLAIAVVAVILLLGRVGAPDASPSPTTTAEPSVTGSPGDTPEAAVRAFFEAFAEARETSDPSVIEPFVNGTGSSAYLTASAFLQGQAEQGQGSIVTVNELTNFVVDQQDDTATVVFDHRLGGYDVELDTGEPLETPVVLPVQRKQVELVLVDGTWLVDSFEDVP
jgi:hypothetical protein